MLFSYENSIYRIISLLHMREKLKLSNPEFCNAIKSTVLPMGYTLIWL